MPGDSSRNSVWGDFALFVDTSAWTRASHPDVVARWNEALRGGRLRISPAIRLEVLFAARDGKGFDALRDELSILANTPLTRSVLQAAEDAMRMLAHRSAGAHRIPIVDYLTAASAQDAGAAVLHYDHDYDTLAEVMSFDSVWIAPAGSLP